MNKLVDFLTWRPEALAYTGLTILVVGVLSCVYYLVTDDTRLPNQSGQTARYDLDVTGQQWQYFRLEISATQGNRVVNIGDIDLDY